MQRPRSSVARKRSRRLVQSIVPPALHHPGATVLVSRFRSSHHYAARAFANFGIKGTLAIYDSSAVFGFEVPTQTLGYNDRNFKSTALVSRFRSSHHCAARAFANFGLKGTPAINDSSAVFGFEVPTQPRGYNDRNFKSTALEGHALRCGWCATRLCPPPPTQVR